MRNWMIAVAALCVAPAASAQDSGPGAAPAPAKEEPAARHVNKISDSARAAFDKFAALVYTPVKGGLKDLTGAIKMEAEFGGGGGEAGGGPGGGGGDRGGGRRGGGMGKMELVFAVAFKAPADLKVELKDAPGKEEAEKAGEGMGARMMKNLGQGMSLAVTRLLRSTLEGFVPATESEFDADLKVENGVSTVLITTYLKGVEVSHEEMTLDANGIPSVMVSTPKVPPVAAPEGPGGRGGREGGRRGMGSPDGKSTVKFSYAKEGDLFRLEKMTMDGPRGPMDATLEYADAGKFKVVRSWEMAPAGGGMKFGFRFSELVVNGKPLALPGETAGGEAKPGEPKAGEPKPGEPKAGEPKPGESKDPK